MNDTDSRWMRHALALAARAEREDDEVPVGALIVDAAGDLLAEGWNRNICDHDPSAHAEIVAMRQAGMRRLARVVYGASDPKTGAAGSVFDLLADPRHNHRIEVLGGVLAEEAGARLVAYFRARRGKRLR
ncbi:MAG: tRNA adenosine(34) deaminase TadA [Gammaproteobacteria bacterium HGW-Gammaproteobacteria-1]|nr:MAG: tRNA adenosine(34) deaminase TadA [Gammaproteobacteria bacterium HGW-Gammaproteobacteria-1]